MMLQECYQDLRRFASTQSRLRFFLDRLGCTILLYLLSDLVIFNRNKCSTRDKHFIILVSVIPRFTLSFPPFYIPIFCHSRKVFRAVFPYFILTFREYYYTFKTKIIKLNLVVTLYILYKILYSVIPSFDKFKYAIETLSNAI